MPTKMLAYAALTLIAIPISVALANPHSLSAAPEVDPAVTFVLTGGHWRTDGRSGTTRLIATKEGTEHVVSRIYLQWIVSDDAGVAIIDTSPVLEINEPQVWSVGAPSLRHEPTGFIFLIPATNSYTLENQHFKLRPLGPRAYTLTSDPP